MISTKRYVVFLCLFIIIMVLMYSTFREEIVNVNLSDFKNEMSKLESNFKTKLHKKRSAWDTKKTIQWYDAVHNNNGLRQRAGVVNFDQCEYKNCKLLHYFQFNASVNIEQQRPLDADAVVFQANHLGGLSPPLRRDNDQVFVFAAREAWLNLGMYDSMMSPSEPHKNMKEVELDWFSKVVPDIFHSPEYYINIVKFRDIFNWTMTYRKDSDIPMLYGQVLHKRDVSDNAKLLLEQENNKKSYDAIYSRKKRDAVWLVSHCSTKSKREKYIEKLKNHINVDILGHCGENLCPKTSRHSGCIEDIVKTYKFVLSFENTFHTDYVTEKLFDWFPRDIIPVVYGMADYNKIVPDGTIINAANFSSPKLLANYLNYVGSNRDVYVKYLRRKRRYVTVGHDVMQQKAYCMLCDWLHNLNTHRKSYSKIDQWWQLNDTSGYITLYKQAMSSSGYSQRMFWVVFLVILLLILFFCQCVTFAYKRLAIRQTVKMTFKLNKW